MFPLDAFEGRILTAVGTCANGASYPNKNSKYDKNKTTSGNELWGIDSLQLPPAGHLSTGAVLVGDLDNAVQHVDL